MEAIFSSVRAWFNIQQDELGAKFGDNNTNG